MCWRPICRLSRIYLFFNARFIWSKKLTLTKCKYEFSSDVSLCSLRPFHSVAVSTMRLQSNVALLQLVSTVGQCHLLLQMLLNGHTDHKDYQGLSHSSWAQFSRKSLSCCTYTSHSLYERFTSLGSCLPSHMFIAVV